jgi:hypothetical protein
MFGELEHPAAIGALAFDDGTGIMQAVGQHGDLGVFPGDELAVEPYSPSNWSKGTEAIPNSSGASRAMPVDCCPHYVLSTDARGNRVLRRSAGRALASRKCQGNEETVRASRRVRGSYAPKFMSIKLTYLRESFT